MAREFFKNLPDTSTPLSASRLNGLLNGNEPMGSIVVDGISSKNLYDKNIPSAGGYISGNIYLNSDIAKSIILECDSNETYTVSKIVSARFTVACYENKPVANATTTNYKNNNSGASITITTGENDKYLVIYYYLSSSDTLTEEEIRESIQVEKGTTATEYKPYIEFKDDITEYTLTNTPEHSAGTNTISLEKSRRTVIFNSLIWFNSLTANTWMTIGTIPTNLRPKKELTTIGILKDGNGNIKNYGQVLVKTNGEVQVKSVTGFSSLTNVAFSLSWFV